MKKEIKKFLYSLFFQFLISFLIVKGCVMLDSLCFSDNSCTSTIIAKMVRGALFSGCVMAFRAGQCY